MQLTPEQQSIIAHDKGHAKVVAVAGAGKTTTLALFIHQQLLNGQNPKRLLVIMYNKSAQQDFTQKLSRTLTSGQPMPQVRTFHALALRIYQTLIQQGHLPAFQGDPIGGGEQEMLLWRLMQQHADKATAQEILQDKKKWLDPMMSFMEQVKSCLEPAALVYKSMKLPAQCRFFVKVFDAFEDWRKQNKRITYADMLYDPCLLFSQRSDLLARFQNHMDWILVDEYQDINPIQQFLLQVLTGERANVMVIGDPDQTIYEFRGSSAHFMLQGFDQQFPDATHYSLSTSFRYGHDVALLANQLIQFNQSRESVLAIANVSNPDTQLIWHQHDDESQKAVQLIINALNEYEPEQICILYRLWGMSAPLELALLENNIPYQMSHHSWVLERFELQTFMMLFEVSAGVFFERSRHSLYQSWLMFFTQPALKIKRAELDDLAKKLAVAGDKAILSFSKMTFPDLSRWQKQQLEERMNFIRMAKDKRLQAHQLLNRYVRETDFYKSLGDSAFSSQQVDDKVATVQGFVRFINKLNIKASDAFSYLQNLKAIKQSQVKQSGIRISSIHKAKGLEWPVVIIPSVNEHYYPYQNDGEMQQPSSIESERRLFYVAMTRSINQLHILSPTIETQNKYALSPFLQQMMPKQLLKVKACIHAGTPELELPKLVATTAKQYIEKLGWPLSIQLAKLNISKSLGNMNKKSHVSEPIELESVSVMHSSFGEGTMQHETERHWHILFKDGQKRVLDKHIAGPLISWL